MADDEPGHGDGQVADEEVCAGLEELEGEDLSEATVVAGRAGNVHGVRGVVRLGAVGHGVRRA